MTFSNVLQHPGSAATRTPCENAIRADFVTSSNKISSKPRLTLELLTYILNSFELEYNSEFCNNF